MLANTTRESQGTDSTQFFFGQALREKFGDTEASNAEDLLGTLLICPNLGIGFDERHQLVAPLVVSAAGQGEIVCSIKSYGPEAYDSLRITLPKVASEVALEQCSVMYRGEQENKEADVTASITFEGEVEDDNGVKRTGAQGARLIVPLQSTVPPWPHALDLRLSMTYLPIVRNI